MNKNYILRIKEELVVNRLISNEGLTTSLTLYLEYYYNSQLGRSIGILVLEYYIIYNKVVDKDNKYYLYANKVDFVLVAQFYTRELSKSNITMFFKQLALKHLYKSLSFANLTKQLNTLYQILYRICNDEQKAVIIAIQLDANNDILIEYIFYYRDIIKVIKFLISYKLFVDNLTYIPI